MAVASDSRIGTAFGGYRIDALIGRGGMSVVYRAHHHALKRNVALKLLSPDLAEDDIFRRRFLRESQLAASLDHPNVVPVYEAGEVEGLLYIAMRFVDGTDLRTVLRREGALGADRSLAVAAQVAGALDAAHERGLIHRDVKPSNVLVTGRPGHEHCYLADFGLSTSMSDRSAAVSPRQIVGTIDYVAPEQIRDEDVDSRADVYSLACMLYECLTGAVPFHRGSDVAVIYAHLEESPPPASRLRAGLPPALDQVLDRGLAKLPDARWQTSGAMVDAAGTALATGGQRRSRLLGRRRLLLLGLAAVAAAIAIAVVFAGGAGTPVARAESLVRLDADGNPAAGIELDGRPTAVTVCAGNVWVTTADGAVSQVDPKTLTVHRVPVNGRPSDVADAGNLAAVVSGPPAHVTVIDGEFGRISGTITLPDGGLPATAVAFGPTIWVANPRRGSVDLLTPPYTAVSGTVPMPGPPKLLAAGERALWAVGGRDLWKIVGREIRAEVRLPVAPVAIAAGNGAVWLVDGRTPRLLRLDPATGRVTKTIRVGRSPVAVAVGPHTVWTVNRADGTVSKVDSARNAVTSTVRVGSSPVDVVAGLGSTWVVRR
jgi:tRNA A-37 threonylcarbamoyl transferase component Bud32/streptogramin lyase